MFFNSYIGIHATFTSHGSHLKDFTYPKLSKQLQKVVSESTVTCKNSYHKSFKTNFSYCLCIISLASAADHTINKRIMAYFMSSMFTSI